MNLTTLNRFLDDCALLTPSCSELILSAVTGQAELREMPWHKDLKEGTAPEMSFDADSGIGTIPIHGVMAYKPDIFEMMYLGMEDTSEMTRMVRNATANQKVKAIMLDVHSPGGFEGGLFDLADAIHEAGKVKPTMAFIGAQGGSGAYLAASQAKEIVASRDARVGSIGVFMVNVDRTRMIKNAGIDVEVFKNQEGKYKGMGQIGTSLTEEHRDFLKASAQQTFEDFRDTVMRARPKVPPEAMQGQSLKGKEAVEKGLVDSTGSMLSALAKLRSKMK